MLITCGSRRQSLVILAVFFLLLTAIFYRHDDLPNVPRLYHSKAVPKPNDRLSIKPLQHKDIGVVHLLLPSSSGQANLCKTLLSAAVLGYPVPTLLSHDETFNDDKVIGGGRFVSKIERTLQWLEDMPDDHDEDLVILVDSYGGFNSFASQEAIDAHLEGDAWFQLPVEVLVQRYRAVTEKANRDLMARMGKAYEAEGIRQSVLFGASKRCTPSNSESSACYPIPEPPVPASLYGIYTADVAYNHTTHLPRYLSSAYTIGPVSSMRAMFRRANEKAQHARNADFSGENSIDAALDLGSDQAIFQHMFGEQEFQREVLRRKYGERSTGRTVVEGQVVEDILDPVFPHEVLKEKKAGEDDFGIGVDYWSDLGMSTVLNGDDGRWLTYSRPIPEQLMTRGPREPWSCAPQVSGNLPHEILNSTSLPRAAVSDASQFSPKHGWDEIPLYTNICYDTIPAIVNHNGDARRRGLDWPEMWMQPHGRRLIEEILDRGSGDGEFEIAGGAYQGINGPYKTWLELCPASVEGDLYPDD